MGSDNFKADLLQYCGAQWAISTDVTTQRTPFLSVSSIGKPGSVTFQGLEGSHSLEAHKKVLLWISGIERWSLHKHKGVTTTFSCEGYYFFATLCYPRALSWCHGITETFSSYPKILYSVHLIGWHSIQGHIWYYWSIQMQPLWNLPSLWVQGNV